MEKDNLEILLEDIRGKFDLVLEGHDSLRKGIRDTRKDLCEKIQFVDFKVEKLSQEVRDTRKELQDTRKDLCEKIQFVDFKVETLSQEVRDTRKDLSEKIQAVAVDLKAHREDTEAHPKIYQVKE